MNAATSEVQDLLGIALETAWLQRTQLSGVSRDALLKAFLLSDLTESSTGCLPDDWQNRPQLQGTFVLQLNEVVNVAAPARDRYKPDSGRRCLKLHLTDGKRTAWAIEMSECAALNCTIAAGCKVILTNPVVQRGYFMLMGGSVQVLGGMCIGAQPVQERRTFQQLMLEAVHAAWPPDEPAGMQVPLPAGGALQQQMIPPGPNAAAVAENTGSHTAQLPCYQDGGASSPRRTHSGSMPCMPNQSQSAHVSMSAGVSAPAADGHAHPAIHPHHFVQSQAAPRHGPEGARPDHQFSGPSMHQHGQSILPSVTWRTPAGTSIDPGDRSMSHGVGPANPRSADPPRVDGRQPMQRTCAAPMQPASAPSAQDLDVSDVIMIGSDDDDDDPAQSLPALGMIAPSGACQGVHGLKEPQECDSDEEGPLLSRPRKMTAGLPAARLHHSGSENSSQGNREGCKVLVMETIADAIAHSKTHPGLEATFRYQVAADFKCQDLILFDESDNVKSFYHIPGIICDRFDCHDGIVKPEFLSECGFGDEPAYFVCGAEEFSVGNCTGDDDAPLVRHMEAVMEKFRCHGTLLLEKRRKYVDTWHVSLPDPLAADIW